MSRPSARLFLHIPRDFSHPIFILLLFSRSNPLGLRKGLGATDNFLPLLSIPLVTSPASFNSVHIRSDKNSSFHRGQGHSRGTARHGTVGTGGDCDTLASPCPSKDGRCCQLGVASSWRSQKWRFLCTLFFSFWSRQTHLLGESALHLQLKVVGTSSPRREQISPTDGTG